VAWVTRGVAPGDARAVSTVGGSALGDTGDTGDMGVAGDRFLAVVAAVGGTVQFHLHGHGRSPDPHGWATSTSRNILTQP